MYFFCIFLPDENLVLVTNGHYSEVFQVVGTGTSILRKCNTISYYPKRVSNVAGDVVSGVPLLCGSSEGDTRGYIQDCYAHDRKSNKWNFVAKMKSARRQPAVVAVSKRLWVTGGLLNDGATASTEYIQLDGTVEQGPNLPFAAREHCMVTLHDGRVMVLGGLFTKRVVIFDPRSNTFTEGPTLLHRRFAHACTLFYSPMHANRPVVLIAGGIDYADGLTPIRSSELLDYTQHNATWVKGNFLYNFLAICIL